MLHDIISKIQPLDDNAMRQAQSRLNQLTKPRGSLGRLEELAVQLAGITGDMQREYADKRVVVMAADHGVVAEGVSAFPQAVTEQMVLNFLAGGAAVNVMAGQAGAQVVCVDVGVAADLSRADRLVDKKIAFGTRNMLREPAMTREQAIRSLEAGIDAAFEQIDDGADLLATGEMGIGNTTASSAILAAFSGRTPEEVAGRGTGIADAALQRKMSVIRQALLLHRPDPTDPIDVLQKVGGFEIGAMAGLILGAAARRTPVVIDGFISTAAALCAAGLAPQAKSYLIPSHLSEEPGHRIALQQLGLSPMLQMNMRLGEGTGAALLFPMIDTTQRIMKDMATFEQAGVSGRSESDGKD